MCYSLIQTALAHTEDGASIIKPYAYIVSVEITNDRPRGKLLVDKEVFTAYVYPGAISTSYSNKLRPRQNGHHFTDDIFKCTSLHENVSTSLKISLKFILKVRINNLALV